MGKRYFFGVRLNKMLSLDLCGVNFNNPFLLAAGVLGSNASSMNWVLRSGAGGVVSKSFSLEANKGYNNPTSVGVKGGILNAIGLSSPGVDVAREEILRIDEEGVKVASIYGSNPKDFSSVASKIEDVVDMIELNVSCPHAMSGCGAAIGQDPDLTYSIVKSVKDAVDVPVIAKLTPNVTDIVEIAVSAEKAGADCLTLINSLGPGMKIDIQTGHPVLNNKRGGMSGSAIKPIAVRCVYDVYEATDLPIMGVGGISFIEDVIEFLYAGASALQIGTAIMHEGPSIFGRLTDELENFMETKGFSSISDMVGLSHRI